MAEIRRSPVEVGNLSHYSQGLMTIPGGETSPDFERTTNSSTCLEAGSQKEGLHQPQWFIFRGWDHPKWLWKKICVDPFHGKSYLYIILYAGKYNMKIVFFVALAVPKIR